MMDVFVGIFPKNFVEPIAEANMLQVIVMALLIGFAINVLLSHDFLQPDRTKPRGER